MVLLLNSDHKVIDYVVYGTCWVDTDGIRYGHFADVLLDAHEPNPQTYLSDQTAMKVSSSR